MVAAAKHTWIWLSEPHDSTDEILMFRFHGYQYKQIQITPTNMYFETWTGHFEDCKVTMLCRKKRVLLCLCGKCAAYRYIISSSVIDIHTEIASANSNKS
jgi:hypothetical protein